MSSYICSSLYIPFSHTCITTSTHVNAYLHTPHTHVYTQTPSWPHTFLHIHTITFIYTLNSTYIPNLHTHTHMHTHSYKHTCIQRERERECVLKYTKRMYYCLDSLNDISVYLLYHVCLSSYPCLQPAAGTFLLVFSSSTLYPSFHKLEHSTTIMSYTASSHAVSEWGTSVTPTRTCLTVSL